MSADLVPLPLLGEVVPPRLVEQEAPDESWSVRDPHWLQLQADVDEWLSEYRSANTKLAYGNYLGTWWNPVTKQERREGTGDLFNGLAWFTLCRGAGVHPYDAPRRLVLHWLELLQSTPQHAGQNRGKPLSKSSRSSALAALTAFYQFAVDDRDRCACSPVTVNRRRQQLQVSGKSTSRSLSEQEFLALLAATDRFEPVDLRPRAKALIALIFTIGCRVSELVNLDRADFRIDQGQRVVKLTTKGDKEHTVPIAGWVWDLIVAYWAADRRGGGHGLALVDDVSTSSGPAFFSRTGRRMSRQTVTTFLKHAARLAGIEDPDSIHPHVARHTVADEADRLGVPITEVQRLLNHANLSTTGNYGARERGYAASPAIVIGARVAQQTA